MLIVVEGIDGSGKTEVGKALAEQLRCELIHFPDDQAVTGPLIRRYLKRLWRVVIPGDVHDDAAGAMLFQSLQAVNRLERMAELNLAAGAATLHAVVVRYWQSGWVYGQLAGLNKRWLMEIHAGVAKPDLNILLDVHPRVARSRQQLRDQCKPPERYEASESVTLKAVELYRRLWRDVMERAPFIRPNQPSGGWPIIEANPPLPHVLACVMDLLPT